MSKRAYTACYIHFIWGVKNHAPIIKPKVARVKVNNFIQEYAFSQDIKVISSFTNPDHVHVLIELPTNQTIEGIVKLIKGSSSHWINHNDIIVEKFAWAVGYAAFTVSKSNLNRVIKYIQNQEEHHKKVTFQEEYERFIKRYFGGQTDESV